MSINQISERERFHRPDSNSIKRFFKRGMGMEMHAAMTLVKKQSFSQYKLLQLL